jgi:CRP-like cAMP-binding protein
MSPRRGLDRRGPTSRPKNRILAALPAAEFARLAPSLRQVTLGSREVVYDPDRPIGHVYFPENCVVSIVGIMSDGSAVETATVGREGMVGLPVFLGTDRISAQAFCQVPGEAFRMTASVFRREIRRGRRLPTLLSRYTQVLIVQIAQSAACNRLHPLRQRCARWLLQTHDRVGADAFPFTHQFLSQMLGVRRATVTSVTGELQSEGLIANHYGRIAIRDRRALEGAACECYWIVRRELERLLEGRESPSPLENVRASKRGKSLAGDGAPLEGTVGRTDADGPGSRASGGTDG